MRLIKVVRKIKYLVVSCDESIAIDNQSLCNVHAYVVDGFKRMPLLLNLEKVVGKGFVDNFATSILRSLMKYGCLIVEQIDSKMVCFALDGVATYKVH
jgi:hypothetical protein